MDWLWSSEGRFSIDDPFQVAHRIQMTLESLRVSQGLQRSEEPQLARVKGLLQILQEQSAEQAGEHPHGQEEVRTAGNPPGAIEGDSAARNDTVKVGMKKQVLSPTMEYGKEADFSSQMFGIGSDSGQGLGHGSKQNVVDDLFVLISDGSDLFGDGEDHMEIVCGEDFGHALLDALCTSEGLALGAMAVPTAVVT